jgi:hypothetical protein
LIAGDPAVAHTTGLAVTETCPLVADQGDTICTITVENPDADHGVINLVVTDLAPFPAVTGCVTTLAANDGVTGSGPDFTSCTVDIPCRSRAARRLGVD